MLVFTPQAAGPRGGSLRIASSDPANNPFTVLLNGAGLTHLEAWRLLNFGSTNNTGNGADLASPHHDGIPNLLKFATGMAPGSAGSQPVSVGNDAGGITFSYSRAKAAVTDGIEFAIEWSDGLSDGTWSTSGVVTQAPVDQGVTERVTASIPAGSGGRGFVHLRVTRP